MMPALVGNFANQTNTTYIMDNNLNTTMVWDTSCNQTATFNSTTEGACSAFPTLVTQSFNLSSASGVAGAYDPEYDSGYENSGYTVINSETLYAGTDFSNETTRYDIATTGQVSFHAVTNITENDWNYGTTVNSGVLAFGLDSKWMHVIMDTVTNTSTYLLEIGNVLEQAWLGANKATVGGGSVYMGPGNYRPLNQTGNTTELYLNQYGDYDLSEMFFGQTTTDDTTGAVAEYYLPLGYSESVTRTIISTSYQGLGLPWYEWN